MIKSISLAYKRPELSHEEFSKYWREQHGPLAARLIPGLRKYVQNHFVMIPGREYEGNGIVEMWYDDVASFEKSMEFIFSPEGKALAEDGAKFAMMKPGGLWVVEEHIIKDELG